MQDYIFYFGHQVQPVGPKYNQNLLQDSGLFLTRKKRWCFNTHSHNQDNGKSSTELTGSRIKAIVEISNKIKKPSNFCQWEYNIQVEHFQSCICEMLHSSLWYSLKVSNVY